MERRPPVEYVLALSQLAGRVESEMTVDSLYSAIGCPVLLACATQGWAQGAPLTDESRRRIDLLPLRFPHVEVAWLDCGHQIPWERPDDLVGLIKRFASVT